MELPSFGKTMAYVAAGSAVCTVVASVFLYIGVYAAMPTLVDRYVASVADSTQRIGGEALRRAIQRMQQGAPFGGR